MLKKITRAAIIGLILLFASCGLLNLYLTDSIHKAEIRHEATRQALLKFGIEPMQESIENYILRSVTIGLTREEVIQKLKPLGEIGTTKIGDECEGISIGVNIIPRPEKLMDSEPFFYQSYAYGLTVCYEKNYVNRIKDLEFLGGINYKYDLHATVVTRLTQTAIPNHP